jgi:hypothetical protein
MLTFAIYPTIAFDGLISLDSFIDTADGKSVLKDLFWHTIAHELAHYYFGTLLLRDACLEGPVDALGLRERVLNEISKSRPRRRLLSRQPVYTLPIAATLLLAIGAGIIYTSLSGSSSQTVYAAALDDHYSEVVQHPTIPG